MAGDAARQWHNDKDISAPNEQKLQKMTESTTLWQTPIQLHMKKISK